MIFFGIFCMEQKNLIGNGVVIDLIMLFKELDKFWDVGVSFKDCLLVLKKVYLILFMYCLLDVVFENVKGKAKIGFIFKGIGLIYMDKMGCNGLWAGDIVCFDFMECYFVFKEKYFSLLEIYFFVDFDLEVEEVWWMECFNELCVL